MAAMAAWRRVARVPLRHGRPAVVSRAYTAAATAEAEVRPAPPPAYVTTPIFYVNAAPHVGHLHTLVLSDALARWLRLTGRPAPLATGTDEHGLKIQQAAQRAGETPQAFCDRIATRFEALVAAAGVEAADFVRTTQPRHHAAVAALWQALVRRGHIYKGEHEGWYCVPDEAFVPESQTELRTDAAGRPVRVSLESGHPLEWVREENYKFRLSAFEGRLRAWLTSDPSVVQPATRYREVMGWLDKGLPDLSVSRRTERVQWGIPVPDDPDHTVYVWLDALTNYLTVADYPWTASTARRDWFPPTYQVIGKDILRFHSVYWPAFLMAAELPLPRRIIAHAHWTVERQKMSKSLGNVVDPFALVQQYGEDAVRLFLLREGGLTDDADFSHDALRVRANHDLADQLGNLLSRASGAALLPEQAWPQPHEFTDADRRVLDALDGLPARVNAAFAVGNTVEALDAVFGAVALANRYFTEAQPWTLKNQRARLDTVLHVALATVRAAALLLQPVIPRGAARALDRLGEPADRRQLALFGCAADWATALPGRALGTAGGVLFPRVANAAASDARKR